MGLRDTRDELLLQNRLLTAKVENIWLKKRALDLQLPIDSILPLEAMEGEEEVQDELTGPETPPIPDSLLPGAQRGPSQPVSPETSSALPEGEIAPEQEPEEEAGPIHTIGTPIYDIPPEPEAEPMPETAPETGYQPDFFPAGPGGMPRELAEDIKENVNLKTIGKSIAVGAANTGGNLLSQIGLRAREQRIVSEKAKPYEGTHLPGTPIFEPAAWEELSDAEKAEKLERNGLEKLGKVIKELPGEWQDEIAEKSDITLETPGKTLGSILNVTAQQLSLLATQLGFSTVAGPGGGVGSMMLVEGGGFNDAGDMMVERLKETGADMRAIREFQKKVEENSWLYGTLSGTVEFAGNTLGPLRGLVGIGKKPAQAAMGQITKDVKSSAMKTIFRELAGYLGEGAEEAAQGGLMNLFMHKAIQETKQKYPDFAPEWKPESLWKNFVTGVAVSPLLRGGAMTTQKLRLQYRQKKLVEKLKSKLDEGTWSRVEEELGLVPDQVPEDPAGLASPGAGPSAPQDIAEETPGDIARAHPYIKTLPEEEVDAFGLADKKRTGKEITKAEEEGKEILVFDVDNFKAINEGYGHDVGDEIIQAASDKIAQSFPGAQALGHFGGDEFAVVFRTAPSTEELEAFVTSFPEDVQVDGQPITISGGVAVGRDEKALVADKMAGTAKKEGKNQIVVQREGEKIYIKGKADLEKPYVREQDTREFRSIVERLGKETDKLPPDVRGAVTRAISELGKKEPGDVTRETGEEPVSPADLETELTPEQEAEYQEAREAEEAQLEYENWTERLNTPQLAPRKATIMKMANFLKWAGPEKRSKETGMLFSEHIPRKSFGIASDELADEIGWDHQDLMNFLQEMPKKPDKPPGSVFEKRPKYSKEQEYLDVMKKQEDMFPEKGVSKAQKALRSIREQRRKAAAAKDKGTKDLPLFEGPDTDADQMSLLESRPAYRPYRKVPDSLMGFKKEGKEPTPFEEQKYKYELEVELFDKGKSLGVDVVKGLNRAHAMERARRNWPSFEVRPYLQEATQFVKEPGAQYNAKKETINLKDAKIPKNSPLAKFKGTDMEVPAGLPEQLAIHKGTPWVRETLMNLEYRREILDLINGRKPKTDHIGRLKGGRMQRYLKKGEKGAWDYLKVSSAIGTPSKPRYAVNSSQMNCAPSPFCANGCFILKNMNYKYGTSRAKSELIDLMVTKNPEKMGEMIAKQFKGLLDYHKDSALRIFDKGDLTPQWVRAIEAINKKGVRVHVFSKKPDLLQQLDPKNIRLLSIDKSNPELAEGNKLPIAFTYTGSQDLDLLEQLKDRIQVILPVKTGSRLLTPEEVAQLPEWSKRYQCPLDAGRKKLPPIGTNDGWTCGKCDRGGGVACYAYQPSTGKEFRQVSELPTQLEAKELMKYAEENLTPAQYKRVLAELRGIIKGMGKATQPSRAVPGTKKVREAPVRVEPYTDAELLKTGNVKYSPQQLDMFMQNPPAVQDLDMPTRRARVRAEKKIPRGFKAIFKDPGYLDIKGFVTKTKEDLNKLVKAIQVWRNPMYETFRVIYTKEGVVVGHEAFSSRLPGQALVMPTEKKKRTRFRYEIKDRMKRLGADGYYMMHNHPGGRISPSANDIRATENYSDLVDGFEGHIIINHGKYSFIRPRDFAVSATEMKLKQPDIYEVQGAQIKTPQELSVVARDINTPKDHIGLIFINSKGIVTGYSSIHKNVYLKNADQFAGTLKNMQRDWGAIDTFAIAPADPQYAIDQQLYYSGIFMDVISESGESLVSLMGARPRKGPTPEFVRVREEEASYDINPPPPSTDPKRWAQAWQRSIDFIRGMKTRVPKEALTMYDRWVRETQTRLFDLAKLKNDLERMGSKVHREAVPFLIEQTEVPAALNRPDIARVLSNPADYAIVRRMADRAEAHFQEYRDYMEENLDQIPEHWIEDYVTHIWDLQDKKQIKGAIKWFSTRNPQLKKRYIETMYKGIQELGLKPKTLDIAEIVSIHGQNTIRTTENKLLLDGLVKLQDAAGVKLIQPATKAPDDWKLMDHPILRRQMYVGEGEKTETIQSVSEVILETVEKIKTIERSTPGVKPSESKPIQKLEQVITGALETRGMTPGEANAYLERLKGVYAGAEVTGEGGERTTESINRRVRRLARQIEQKVPVKYPLFATVPIKFHPDLEPLMTAVFASPWKPEGKVGAIVNAWEGANAILKQTQLGISFFHHIALGEAAVAAMGPVKTIKVALNLKAMWDALGKGEHSMFMAKYEVAKDAVNHGLMLGANLDVQKHVVDKMIEVTGDFVEKHSGKALAAPIRAAGWGKEKWDQALWDYYHNNLKLTAYEFLVSKELARQQRKLNKESPGQVLTEERIDKIKDEMAYFVNDTFGGQNLMAQMSDPNWMRAFRAGFLSPDWLVSTLKQAGSVLTVGTRHKELKGARALMGAKFWLRAAMYFGGMSMLFNFIRTKWDDAEEEDKPFAEGDGKWMWENDPGHETHLFWGRGPEGEKIYLRHGKQFREGPEFFYDAQAGEWSPITAALKKFGGKAAPVPQILSTVITGKTLSRFDEKLLRDTEGWERVWGISKYLSSTWLPFSFSALKDERKKWDPVQFAFPTSKGMSAYKTRKYMKTALQKENLDHLRRIWISAIENNIPQVEKIFDQAVRELMYDAEEEYRADLRKHGITEKQLEKITTQAQLMTANKEVRRMVRKKKALERMGKLDIMEKKLEGYLKRKKALETRMSPQDRKEQLKKIRKTREEYRLLEK